MIICSIAQFKPNNLKDTREPAKIASSKKKIFSADSQSAENHYYGKIIAYEIDSKVPEIRIIAPLKLKDVEKILSQCSYYKSKTKTTDGKPLYIDGSEQAISYTTCIQLSHSTLLFTKSKHHN